MIGLLCRKSSLMYDNMYDDTHSDMGWLQSVGSIKLQVSFAKEPYKRDDLLQKRPTNLSILLTKATPYVYDIHISE